MFTLNGCTPVCPQVPYRERVYERIEKRPEPIPFVKKQVPAPKNSYWIFALFLALLVWTLFQKKK